MTTRHKHTGPLCVFLAALLYSIGGLCIKVIPWGGMAINGGRTAIALAVIGLYLAAIRHRPRLNRWVLLGALCIFGTNTFFSLANKLTTAANTIVLQFTAPIFVILFSALFWRKKPRRLDLAACAVVFGGVLFFFVDSLEAGGALGNLLAILEGSAGGRAANIAVYATSNRRHLVKETLSDRSGDDLHESDTRQELMSLSARFGLIVTFQRPDKALYSKILLELARQNGLHIPDDVLITRGEAFAIRAGGRSPRAARQFIEQCRAGIL